MTVRVYGFHRTYITTNQRLGDLITRFGTPVFIPTNVPPVVMEDPIYRRKYISFDSTEMTRWLEEHVGNEGIYWCCRADVDQPGMGACVELQYFIMNEDLRTMFKLMWGGK